MLVLLTFVGTWLAHTVEYLRVNGPDGLVRVMTSSVHLYMLPLGAVLLVAAAVGGVAWLRGVMVLADRLQGLGWALRKGRRFEGPSCRFDPSSSGQAARLGSLWLPLGLAQIGLYLVQENLESFAAGRHVPGMGAVFGAHWAAVPIHLGVALAPVYRAALSMFGSSVG